MVEEEKDRKKKEPDVEDNRHVNAAFDPFPQEGSNIDCIVGHISVDDMGNDAK